MKKLFLVFLLIVPSQLAITQTKFDAYEFRSSDSETGSLDNFIIGLSEHPDSLGQIVIYTAKDRQLLGNILPQIEGIKTYISYRKFDPNRITFIISEGDVPFSKEMWLTTKQNNAPQAKAIETNLNGLLKKYLYAKLCIDCEPAERNLSTDQVDWNLLGKTLKENKKYDFWIEVQKGTGFDKNGNLIGSVKYAAELRKRLAGDYQLNSKRIHVKIDGRPPKDHPTLAYFYIIPRKN